MAAEKNVLLRQSNTRDMQYKINSRCHYYFEVNFAQRDHLTGSRPVVLTRLVNVSAWHVLLLQHNALLTHSRSD